MPDPGRSPAADWLLAVCDATGNPFQTGKSGHREFRVPWRGVYVQPMFSLRNPVKSGQQMRVTTADYNDPGRWWL
jgi:hypothetical protein